MIRNLLILLALSGFALNSCTPEPTTADPTGAPLDAEKRLAELSARMVAYLPQIPVDSMAIPRTMEDGKMKGTKSRSWTSGFFPGLLWELYEHSNDPELKAAAEQWQAFVEKEKFDEGTHDLGFKIYCPYGNAYLATGKEEYKEVFLTASRTLLTRYNENVGAIRSWDFMDDVWQFPVIIDNMMNLEMLFEATRLTGDSSFHKIAEQHALTTLEHHFRTDNSSYHVVSYDTITGAVEKKETHQGFSHESDWSRGQAWGLYGYTVAYQYTGREEFRQKAEDIAAFIFTHPNLPEDLIPYWDYDAPNIPDEPRDVSAAAVTASGLFALADVVPANAKQYREWANAILVSLEKEEYQLDVPPFFLQHSVGSIPGEFEMDAPIIYADYYYVEALNRSVAAARPNLNKAVAHVLVQDFAYDAADKTRTDGPYKNGGTFDIPLDLSSQNKWFMFEGPVLENDKVAYRTYADSRHRFDVYGKRVGDIVMDTVSWDYHDIMDWGSDILKVGNSLGIGSPGIWYKDSVYTLSDYDRKEVSTMNEEGGVAGVRFRFDGLRIGDKEFDLDQLMRLAPGRYDMEVEMEVRTGELPEGMTFVTGIVKHLPEAKTGKENGFTYVQNWGKQSFHKENMGMAVLAANEFGPRPGADELSHLLHFDDARRRVAYRVLTGWERDQSGTKDAAGFARMVSAATK